MNMQSQVCRKPAEVLAKDTYCVIQHDNSADWEIPTDLGSNETCRYDAPGMWTFSTISHEECAASSSSLSADKWLDSQTTERNPSSVMKSQATRATDVRLSTGCQLTTTFSTTYTHTMQHLFYKHHIHSATSLFGWVFCWVQKLIWRTSFEGSLKFRSAKTKWQQNQTKKIVKVHFKKSYEYTQLMTNWVLRLIQQNVSTSDNSGALHTN